MISLPLGTPEFCARLACVVGLTSGCGGIAVFVEDGGEGGSGGSGSSTTSKATTVASSSSTGIPFTCPVPEAVYACASVVGSCPPAGSAEAFHLMNLVLGKSEQCEESCQCTTFVSDVPCGPDPNASGHCCCYYAVTAVDMVCKGRPFTAGGEAVVPPVAERGDWAAPLAVHSDGLDATTRRALADAWLDDARFEHASIASFARFVLELLAVGAPPHLVRGAQEALQDELRHAELCFGVASALGERVVGPGPLALEGALEGRSTLAEVTVAVVREGDRRVGPRLR